MSKTQNASDLGHSPNQGVIGLCPDHTKCQKLKAENECFHSTVRRRIGKSLKDYNLPEDLESKILEIIELILNPSIYNIEALTPTSLALETMLPYCKSILLENEINKYQYFKISYFLECLEKSKLSIAHLHRISIFLQTGIFRNSDIKEFFEQMTSTAPLYECTKCKIFAPVDTSLDVITTKFYASVTNRCKECFKVETKERYRNSISLSKSSESKTKEPSGILISKIYLCMKCGEDNFINFYERNKSKCKFCILAERRGIYALGPGEQPLGASASKKHHCKECHTENPKNFRETYKSLCYACYLNAKRIKKLTSADSDESAVPRKEYFCEDCETKEPSKFRRGYKSRCYECFLKTRRIKDPLGSIPESSNSKAFKGPCKHCKDTDYRNFNEGMDTICARCEEIEFQSYICSKCKIESLRSNFSEDELKLSESNPSHKILCNLCNPEMRPAVSQDRKPYKCDNCEETNPDKFYEGFKSKCKMCTREERRQKYELKMKMNAESG
jgi:hypothetical protein